MTVPLMSAFYGDSYWTGTDLIMSPFGVLVEWILPALAVIVFWIAKQTTLGKMVISAKILDADSGKAPSTRQFIARYLAYYVSLIPLGLGFLWIAFDKRKQGWHDKLAATVAVRPKAGGPEPVKFKNA
jgi:uncharacterized RDD family membrane protein YckC